jgi:hypothetical protein
MFVRGVRHHQRLVMLVARSLTMWEIVLLGQSFVERRVRYNNFDQRSDRVKDSNITFARPSMDRILRLSKERVLQYITRFMGRETDMHKTDIRKEGLSTFNRYFDFNFSMSRDFWCEGYVLFSFTSAQVVFCDSRALLHYNVASLQALRCGIVFVHRR